MEQLSRVKKYADLRNSIENEQIVKKVPSETEETIKKITRTNKMNDYVPTHEKDSGYVETVSRNDFDSSFKNEYLDSFIQEVRDYNIKKGIREYEDTRLDILQQLNSKNREKRANYVESIETENNRSEETMEISKAVFELLNEDENKDHNVVQTVNKDAVVDLPKEENTMVDKETMEKTKEENKEIKNENESTQLEKRIAMLESQLIETNQQLHTVKEDKEDDFDRYSKTELMEETRKLKVQMEEYKDELNDLNNGVDSSNRLLNIIITILIIALLSVIGIVVYWLVSGGII